MQLAQGLYRIGSYLRHRLTAFHTGGEGIHSPYLFYWVRFCLYDSNRYYAFSAIERQRQLFLQSHQQVTLTDYGTGQARPAVRPVRQIAATSLEKAKNAQILFRLVQFLSDPQWQENKQSARPLTIIELGTSLGITTAYLASPAARNRIFTLEGSQALVNLAKPFWQRLGRTNITPIVGNIDDTLPRLLLSDTASDRTIEHLDLVFMDANHTYEATLRYWNHLLPFVHNKSVVVLDDIHYSREMNRAWKTIRQSPEVTCTMDLYDMGLVFFDPAYLRRHYRLRI